MATAIRNSAADFMAAVSGRGINGGTSKNIYSCVQNADGTITVSKNGVAIFKCIWPGTGSSSQTDAGGTNQDSVSIQDSGSLSWNTGSAQAFINSLI